MPKNRKRQFRIEDRRLGPVRCVDGDLVRGQRQRELVQICLDPTGSGWKVVAHQQDPRHQPESSGDVTRGIQLVRSADPAHRGDLPPRHRDDLHHVTALWSVHIEPVTNVDADVADRGIQSNEIARLQIGTSDATAHPRLFLS